MSRSVQQLEEENARLRQQVALMRQQAKAYAAVHAMVKPDDLRYLTHTQHRDTEMMRNRWTYLPSFLNKYKTDNLRFMSYTTFDLSIEVITEDHTSAITKVGAGLTNVEMEMDHNTTAERITITTPSMHGDEVKLRTEHDIIKLKVKQSDNKDSDDINNVRQSTDPYLINTYIHDIGNIICILLHAKDYGQVMRFESVMEDGALYHNNGGSSWFPWLI